MVLRLGRLARWLAPCWLVVGSEGSKGSLPARLLACLSVCVCLCFLISWPDDSTTVAAAASAPLDSALATALGTTAAADNDNDVVVLVVFSLLVRSLRLVTRRRPEFLLCAFTELRITRSLACVVCPCR